MLALIVLLALLLLIQSPAFGQEPTPTPFWNPTVEARIQRDTIERCLRYLPLVERWQPDFPEIKADVVFAIAAQESHCNHTAGQVDRVGSIGLMQVAPLPGRPPAARLAQPAINVYWGMKVLSSALDTADGDMRLALAAYNCGFEGVENDACGSSGGYAYADKILNTWLPMSREMLGWITPQLPQHPEETATVPPGVLDTDQQLQQKGFLPTEEATPQPTATESVVPAEETKPEGELEMKRDFIKILVLLAVTVLALALVAFQVVDEGRIEEIVAGIVGFAVMLFGPRPLKWLYDLIGLPGGAARVIATYVVSGIVGVGALIAAGAFADVTWNLETVLAFAGALATAAQIAYHRLKDLRSI